jgi:hypothetical protein
MLNIRGLAILEMWGQKPSYIENRFPPKQMWDQTHFSTLANHMDISPSEFQRDSTAEFAESLEHHLDKNSTAHRSQESNGRKSSMMFA